MIELLDRKEWKHSRYIAGLANTEEEKDEVYKLRYDIFNMELKEGIKENEAIKRDIDKFDYYCDHLIIKDLVSDKIIATYRIHPSWKMNKHFGFYSSTEFDISKLELDKIRSMEMGRACINPEHRGSSLVIAMWSAIKNYIIMNNVDALFGVASIPQCSIEELSALHKSLVEKGQIDCSGLVKPLDALKVDLLDNPPETFRKELKGALLKGYIKIGAKLMSEPVYDPVFGCYDYFILLEMKNANWDYIDNIFSMLNR